MTYVPVREEEKEMHEQINVKKRCCCCWLLLSHVQFFRDPTDCSLPGSSVQEDFPDKNIE